MNAIYQKLVLGRIQNAVQKARDIDSITHPGMKGRIREIVIGDILRPMLPSDVGVATGKIITFDGRESRQQDVLIYDRQILPPFLFETEGLFSIESVLYTIEVKSRLTRHELITSIRNAEELSGFPYLPGKYDEFDKPVDHDILKVMPAIFAFDSDLVGDKESEIDRYCNVAGSRTTPIGAICVVSKGYWYWNENEKS